MCSIALSFLVPQKGVFSKIDTRWYPAHCGGNFRFLCVALVEKRAWKEKKKEIWQFQFQWDIYIYIGK
jgi:hypothetical protein